MSTTFGILGGTALLIDGRLREDWGRPRERAVVATLLVHAGRWVPINTLIEWAWSEDEPLPRNPTQTFHNYSTRIRKWLSRLPSPPTLQPGNGGYRLDADRSQIDYHQFRKLIIEARAQARDRHPKQALELAEQALDLWRGQPLAGLTSEPAVAWRRSVIQNQLLPAHVTMLRALVDLEEFDDALVRLDELQADHPLDLHLAKLRISVLRALSKNTEGYAFYTNFRRQLLDEHADEQSAEHLRRHYESVMSLREPPARQPLEPSGPPRQLPHDIRDFVGRDNLLAALDTATTTPSGGWAGCVVVLDGMAGVGKTALAIRWAHRARHRFPDGDLYVNLNGFADSPVVEPAAVVDDFLVALGHPPDANQTPRSKELLLSTLLASRQMLVLLDNAQSTAHIRDLVPLLSNCVVLVTSRQRLSTLSAETGARRVRVDPMPDVEVSELISGCLRPRRLISLDHLARLIPLCSGLPLAAIFLADHVATRPDADLTDFVDRLDHQQLIVEIGGHGDGPANLRAFFDWSYHRLTTAAQRLFRLLGLHPGPDLSIDAACACDGRARAETVQSLSELVGAHLIEQPQAFDRYRFHDLLREFAAERAQTDELESERHTAALRCIDFYLASAEEANELLYPSHLAAPELPTVDGARPISFTDPDKAKQWFGRERGNLVAVTNKAFTLGHHEHVWRLADVVATSFDRRGFHADSRQVRELALQSAQTIGNSEVEMSALVSLGLSHVGTNNEVEARRYLESALRLADAQEHDRARSSALHQLGRLEMMRGDTDSAIDLYGRALEIARRNADNSGLCWNHCRLGQALCATGDLDLALLHLHQAQWLAQRIGDNSAHAYSLAGIGSVFHSRDDFHTASAYCEQALAIAESVPDLVGITQVCIALAEIHLASDDGTAALTHAGRAVEVCQQTHDLPSEARAHELLGDAHLDTGDIPQAIEAWSYAYALYAELGKKSELSRLVVKLKRPRPGGNGTAN